MSDKVIIELTREQAMIMYCVLGTGMSFSMMPMEDTSKLHPVMDLLRANLKEEPA